MVYLLMIGIGMLFNYQRYIAFDINIFQFADLFDFLVAPFEDWRILVFSLISSLIIALFFVLDQVWQKKWPENYSKVNFGWDKKPWFNAYRLTLFAALFVYYLVIGADVYAVKTKARILGLGQTLIHYADDTVISGQEIGKTKSVIFLYQDEEVKIIPFTSLVKWIEPVQATPSSQPLP